MCGRYENAVNKDELDAIFAEHIGKLHIDYDIDEVFIEENIAPTDRIRTIVLEDGMFKVKSMKWGIRSKIYDPSRKSKGKDPFVDKDIFNSKLETISKSENWKGAFESSRCLIPMTAFYEWPVIDGKKSPQRISLENQRVFFAGGIYKDKDLKGEIAASIITCPPNEFMKHIHHRMPLLFTVNEASEFLKLPFEGILSVSKTLDDDVTMEIEPAKL